MKPHRLLLPLATLLVAGLAPAIATADPLRCDSSVGGWGRAANGLNYEPPRHYDTVAVARQRAIATWKHRVRIACPDHSAFWWRAHDKNVQCDGYAGGTACRVRARPAVKFFR